MLNLVGLCYVSLCEGLRAGAGSLSYIVHVDCCGLSTIVIKKIIIIIIITILYAASRSPEVKMSESKVRLQMVNVKYNYFRLHALLPSKFGEKKVFFGQISCKIRAFCWLIFHNPEIPGLKHRQSRDSGLRK